MADYAFMPEDEQPESAAEWTGSGDPEVALSCPSCGTLLDGEELFEVYRVCPSCRRHFWLPARERLHLLVDPGSFAETNAELASIDPRFGILSPCLTASLKNRNAAASPARSSPE
jgi:acetyl-CoA carboxylase beta subunit